MTKPINQLNMFTTPEMLRDEGMERVLENSGPWRHQAKRCLRILDWPGAITFEKIRHMIEVRIGSPHAPEAWGSLSMWANKQGLIEHVGWDKMRDLKSHAHIARTYRRVK